MTNSIHWKEGKTYKTVGGLYAQITQVNKQAIPRDLPYEERMRLLTTPFYGIEGYVFLKASPEVKYRGSWTLEGKHLAEAPDYVESDLTVVEVSLPDSSV